MVLVPTTDGKKAMDAGSLLIAQFNLADNEITFFKKLTGSDSKWEGSWVNFGYDKDTKQLMDTVQVFANHEDSNCDVPLVDVPKDLVKVARKTFERM